MFMFFTNATLAVRWNSRFLQPV